MPRLINRTYWLSSAVVLMLVSIHFFCLVRYGINIPFSDDYVEILENVTMILDSDSITESAGHILQGNGYSKPITIRLISLLHISLLHEINFKYLVITGNIFLLLVCFIFIVSSVNINKYLIITAACFIFQPQYWEALYQSTLSNSVFACLFFSLASIYCMMQKSTFFFIASIVSAVLAQISFGNGILVYPVLLMISFTHKNFRKFAVVFSVMVLCTYLYMLGNTVSYTAGQQMGLLQKFQVCTVWLLEFIGSSVGYAFSIGYERNFAGKSVSTVVGFLILFFYGVLIKKKYYRTNLLLFSFLTFFILTSFLTTAMRCGSEVPGASRYQIQSSLCFLTALIIVIERYAAHFNRVIIIILTVALPLAFVLTSYNTNLPVVANHRTRLIAGLISWKNSGKGLTIWSGEETAGKVLTQSIDRGLYHVPSYDSMVTDLWKY